jgi:hypothetical protein
MVHSGTVDVADLHTLLATAAGRRRSQRVRRVPSSWSTAGARVHRSPGYGWRAPSPAPGSGSAARGVRARRMAGPRRPRLAGARGDRRVRRSPSLRGGPGAQGRRPHRPSGGGRVAGHPTRAGGCAGHGFRHQQNRCGPRRPPRPLTSAPHSSAPKPGTRVHESPWGEGCVGRGSPGADVRLCRKVSGPLSPPSQLLRLTGPPG